MTNDEELIIFKRILLNCPDPERRYEKQEYVLNKNKSVYYLLFSWMSNDGLEHEISAKAAAKQFSKYGITEQIYFDILVLNIYDPNLRPKCECGNYTKFISISYGYRKYCNKACMYKYRETNEPFRLSKRNKGYHHSEETRKKISESNTGKKHTPETIEKLKRNARLGLNRTGMRTPMETREKQRQAALRRIAENPESVLKNFYSNRKTGKYKPAKSEKEIKYLSSWELKFMKICDLSKDVIKIDTVESIPYTFDGKDHLYIPDFKLTLSTGLIVIIEIKPKNLINDPKVLAKRISAIKYCKTKNYKYVTLTEIELFKRIKGSFNIYDYIV